MRSEYDFDKAERGKFYRPDAVFHLPVYLESDVDEFIRNLAEEKGKDTSALINEWLRGNIRLIQSAQ